MKKHQTTLKRTLQKIGTQTLKAKIITRQGNISEPRFIDLFAGIGGFHLAFHKAGGKCVFVSEIDEHARRTYETNIKKIAPELFTEDETFFTRDIKEVNENTIPDFDILCAGFPCQPFSQAGFKRGFSDTRGTLFHDIVRILRAKKPAAFFLENVRGLLSHNSGKTFEVIRNTLTKDLGYTFHHKIVRASDHGLPQHRPRLFMVGFKEEHLTFSFPAPTKLKKTMSDIWGGTCPKTVGYTLRVGGRGSGLSDRRNWDTYLVNGEIKRLSPKEGKAMMGFPKSYEFPVTETQAMKQLGNSVAVSAVYAVAKEITTRLKNNA
jgi:DNA (cytosine-5)-methyltransferase 1